MFVEELEVEGVLEVTAVEEPVDTGQESTVHSKRSGSRTVNAHGAPGTETAVVFQLQGERSQLGARPEIQAACNLEIGVVGRDYGVAVLVVVIVIDKEEGVIAFGPLK